MREKRLQEVCLAAAQQRLLSSAHDVAEGGLAVALAEACISHPTTPQGARITLQTDMRPDVALFSESQSRVLVSLPPAHWSRLQALIQTADLPYTHLGEVGGTSLVIEGMLDLSVDDVHTQWRTRLATQLT